MKRMLPVAVLVVALVACGKQRVATQPEMPPLVPPPPPPRVVTPAEPDEVPPLAKPIEAPTRKPPRPSTRAPEHEPPRTVEPPKQDIKPPEPVVPPKDQPTPSTLQMGKAQELDRQARGLLAQAKKDLDQVQPRNLNADARGQYDLARRFYSQAEQALRDENFVLAQNLAEKAATIAGLLVGR